MWITLTTADILSELTPAETAALQTIQGATDQLTPILSKAVAQARGAIRAGGYPLGDDGTIPDQLASDVTALARWRWLTSFPQLQRMQTKERKDAHDAARELLEGVARQKFNIEPPPAPDGATPAPSQPASGSWNSENKLVMRTHPIPPPAVQWQSTDNTQEPYANPSAPTDNT